MSLNTISGISFDDDEYFVKQHLVRNKYEIYDSRDNLIMHAKQKLFKMKEEIPFTDPQGNEIFSIKAKKILDIAGDYALVDKRSGGEEVISVLQKDFTFFRHSWKIKDKNNKVLVNVTSRSMLFDVLRAFSSTFNFLPFKYSIETSQGKEIGEIDEKLSLKDKYWVRISDTNGIPKETLVASAIAIDALEGR